MPGQTVAEARACVSPPPARWGSAASPGAAMPQLGEGTAAYRTAAPGRAVAGSFNVRSGRAGSCAAEDGA
jgi:hypothetical protein